MTTPTAGRMAAQFGIVVAALAATGAVAGVLWQWVWSPTMGVVVDHRWTPADALGLEHEFSATGWYVVIAAVAGLVAGVVVALLVDEVPLLTLAAVTVGSVLAAWVMVLVGTALGPSDPAVLARTAAEGTKLPIRLTVSGHSPWIAFPTGALLGLLLVFVGISSRRVEREPAAEVTAD